MFTTSVEATQFALTKSKLLLHLFVNDLKPEEFEYQACEGANCASWILGHLALTDRRMLSWLGVTDLPALPQGFEERFTTTRAKAEKQAGYGDPKELIAIFDAHRDRLIAELPKASAVQLAEPAPIIRPMFSTVGEAILFMSIHATMHAGQLSMVRRTLGYPPAM